MRWLHFLCLGLLVACAGCIATETGNPGARPVVDPSVIEGEIPPDVPLPGSPPRVLVRGRPGSVNPAEGRALGWALETNSPRATATVEADGGFWLEVEALADELVRVQVEDADGLRSLPLDVRVSATAGLSVATEANPCMRLMPASRSLELSATSGDEAVIELVNECDAMVVRERATLRDENVAFRVTDEGPLMLEPGSSAQIRIMVVDSGTAEDIVQISVRNPVPELRSISLLAI